MCNCLLTCLTKVRLCCCKKRKNTVIKFYDYYLKEVLTKNINVNYPQIRGDLLTLIKPKELSDFKLIIFEGELGRFAYYTGSLYLTEDILYPIDIEPVLNKDEILYAYTDENEDIGFSMESFYDPFDQMMWGDYKKINEIKGNNIIGTGRDMEDKIFTPNNDTLLSKIFETE